MQLKHLKADTRFLLLFFLVLAATASWWLLQLAEPGIEREAAGARHDPDFYLKDFTLTVMGETGFTRHQLVAASMVHYPDDGTATLEAPRLDIYEDNRVLWNVVAERGLVKGDGDEIDLLGAVEIRREGVPEEAMVIATRDLHVDTREDYAETPERVTITHVRGVTKALGMRIEFDGRRLFLNSEVVGEYESSID